jgi:chromatin segregation and condensation protein Rec8/ScpA/Scc1 (kleisin family)
MSLSTRTLKRIPIIKESLRKGLNREQIGEKCGVTEKTIDRDMKAWVESGLFEIWLKEEFIDLHNYARDADPITAYKEIARIVGRMVTRKIEAHTLEEIKVEEKHVSIVGTLREYEEAIERAADQNLQAERARKQVDTNHADT